MTSLTIIPHVGTVVIDSTTTLNVAVQIKADGARSARKPIAWSFCIDRSGSMHGAKLQNANGAVAKMIALLPPGDSVSVVYYDDWVSVAVDQQIIGANTRPRFSPKNAGGCTNISKGINASNDMLLKENIQHRRIVMLSDGEANIGVTDAKALALICSRYTERNVTITTIGMGSGYNERVLSGMSTAGKGNFYNITDPRDAEDVFESEVASYEDVIAEDLKITYIATNPNVVPVGWYGGTLRNGNACEVQYGSVRHSTGAGIGIQFEIKDPSIPISGEVGTVVVSYTDTETQSKVTINRPLVLKSATIDEVATGNINTMMSIEGRVLFMRLMIADVKDKLITTKGRGNSIADIDACIELIGQLGLMDIEEHAEELEILKSIKRAIATGRDDELLKELTEQASHGKRNNSDMAGRGGYVATGSISNLPIVADKTKLIKVVCVREKSRIRVKVDQDGYNRDWNVMFPRDIRIEGAVFYIEGVEDADGKFYRMVNEVIYRDPSSQYNVTTQPKKFTRTVVSKLHTTADKYDDLPTASDVGTGVLVQCIMDGKKLRARVIQDGFNPNMNMRFPRSIREDGKLYVVENVTTAADGKSYTAHGSIKRLV